MHNVHPHFWLKLSGKKPFTLIFNSIIYLFIFRNKTNYHISEYYFAYSYHYGFLESYFECISINKRIKNIYIDTELVLPMYNVHTYLSLKNLSNKVHIICGKIQYSFVLDGSSNPSDL